MEQLQQDAQPLMQVTAVISRSDLLAFKLYSLPRVKSNWVCWAGMTLLAFSMFIAADYFLATDGAGDPAHITGLAAISFLLSTAGMVAGVVVNLVLSLLYASEKSGHLGARVFSLRKEGFHERTAVNEGLHRWQGIYSIEESRSYLYVGINWYSFHIVPVRAFASRGEFEKFTALARELWAAGLRSS